MKYTFLETLMLSKYFSLKNIVGEGYLSSHELFDKLAMVYCIPEKQAEALFEISERDEISSITRYEDYLVDMRALDYQDRFGESVSLAEDVMFALNCKGQGLRVMREFSQTCGKYPAESKLKTCLLSQKLTNNIHVAFATAFLSYQGIILPQDVKRGKQYAEKAMQWNDINGTLLLLFYSKKSDRNKYLSILYTLADCYEIHDELQGVYSHYGWERKGFSKEAHLIADYLDRNPEALELFDPTISKIARATFLSMGDRKRLLESGDRAAIGQIFDLALSNEVSDPGSVLHLREQVSQERENEANQVEVCLSKQRIAKIKPPILVCRDNIALRLYAKALDGFDGANTFYIDVSNCSGGCFAPTKGNLIIKHLIKHNTGAATFIFGGVSEIEDAEAEQLSVMLNSVNQGSYLLQDVNIMVDLSHCVFVLLADREDIHESITKVCQRIEINAATKEEAIEFVEHLINENKSLYDCPELAFQPEAVACLAKYDVFHMGTVIAMICRQHTSETDKSIISQADVIRTIDPSTRQIAFNIRK